MQKYYGAPEESRWENYFAFPQNKFPLIHREKAELYDNKVLCSVQLSFSVVFAWERCPGNCLGLTAAPMDQSQS